MSANECVCLPIWVSKTLPQKFLFATTNMTTRDILQPTKANWITLKVCIEMLVKAIETSNVKSGFVNEASHYFSIFQLAIWSFANF